MYKIYYKDENCLLLQGHVLDVLKSLKSESIDCCITSPPYWALRDYGTDSQVWGGDSDCEHNFLSYISKQHAGRGDCQATGKYSMQEPISDSVVKAGFCNKCNAWRGDFGLEPDFDLYIKHLLQIFDEIQRVLKKSGTCWVVIGDTYFQSGGAAKQYRDRLHTDQGLATSYKKYTKGEKNRIGGFKKYAGHKVDRLPPKCLCSIPQRFQIGMCDRGWTLRNVIIWHKPSCVPSSTKDRLTVDFEYVLFFTKNKKYFFDYKIIMEPVTNEKAKIKMRHKRTVWNINAKSYKEAHFATFPPALIKPMILAGCPENGVVLDPFGGSGTTAMISLENNRKCVSVDLKKEYLELHKKRLNI